MNYRESSASTPARHPLQPRVAAARAGVRHPQDQHGVARIKLGLADELVLGNLEARRDWGYAEDYVEAMWLMLQQDAAQDYVIGTGVTHSVSDFVEAAFACVDLNAEDHVRIDPELVRPADIEEVVADPRKAKQGRAGRRRSASRNWSS